LPKIVALPAFIMGAAKRQLKVIAKPEKLTIDNGQLTIAEAAFRRNVVAFVVGTAILAPKSETGPACFLGGFATGLFALILCRLLFGHGAH
jgi:hypothetical protein